MAESAGRRGFGALWVTQFQGAFSDNIYKMLLTFIILGLGLAKGEQDWLILWVGVLFAVPVILFSMSGGWLASRFSKRTVTIGVKVLEIGVMATATVGLLFQNIPLLLACMFMMSLQSALFGPSKYGLLPELLTEDRLSWGNGILQMGTNVAILLGTVAAGLLADWFAGRHVWSGVILVGLAGVGTISSLGIARVPAANPQAAYRFNFLGDLFHQLRYVRHDRVLMLAMLGNVYFSFLGSMLMINVTMYGDEIFHLSFRDNSLLTTSIAVGVGLGAVAAGYLSGRKIEYGLVPLGSIGLTVFCAMLSQANLSVWDVRWLLGALGFFGGFYVVPVGAILQYRPDPSRKGGVLGASNLLSFGGVMMGFAVNYLLRRLDLTPPDVFLVGSLMTLAGTAYVCWLLPDALLRLFVWFFTHTIYRLRVEGRLNIPEKGGALFVCNHVSFVDALLIIGSTDRMIRAVMLRDIYENPIVKPFAKAMRAIPISSQQRPREMIRSLRLATEAINNGEIVCIFAEGQITRIGQLLPFRRGMTLIMKGVTAPIIPICLDNVWGSIFSYERGRFFGKIPRYFPYPVTVTYGKPLPPTSTPSEVRRAVQELNSEAWQHRRPLMRTLQWYFIRTAHRHPLLFSMADQRSGLLNFAAVLMKSLYLTGRLGPVWSGQRMVGILLPPSVGGALVNYAAMLLGKVPVNLNYTASSSVIADCARQCEIKTVITSRAFVEKARLTPPANAVYLEDVAAHPRLGEKLRALAMWPVPAPLLARWLGGNKPVSGAALDELMTVIFSSGSTGDPKGVTLTQYNVISNVEQMGQTFAFRHHDKLLGILPFFHSFGFSVTLALPAVLGLGVVFHPTPLDAKAIGELVETHRVTFLLATPTFLQIYIRGCEPEQFGSLQYVITGAEKLPDRLLQAFEERFGIRPLEGYGATECSPVVSVNTRDFRAPGFRQVGAKRGKIGHPLPGMTAKIVDPETFEPLPVGRPGMLLVKGPNVMKGYLGKPDKTAEVLRDGWYVTGDIAAEDEDGFLTITDRLSRFSKIGGEMVPHIKVEEKLHELAGCTEQCFVVTGVPDEKKGERLAVLYTVADERLQPCLEKLAGCDWPNLWKPRGENFYRVETLPYLGTGKLDLRRVKELALELSKNG